MKRIPCSKKTRQEIRVLFEQGVDEGDPKIELMKLAMRLIMEEALEAKVKDLLGRGYYERGAGRGSRNGNRRGTLKTAEGRVKFGVPQVRDVDAAELAALRDALKGRTDALEGLAVEM